MYKRLDEVKEHADTTYVRRDICHERVDRISKDVEEIKGDVKKLLFKNGIK